MRLKEFTVEDLKEIPKMSISEYTKSVDFLALYIQQEYGIYFKIPIVQSLHESNVGNSKLARNYCNLFGITATESWKKQNKPFVNMPTWEFVKGKRIELKREFRVYPSWRSSFENWAEIITQSKCYKKAYALMRDKKTALNGIEEMAKVYATDPNYAKKMIALYKNLLKEF